MLCMHACKIYVNVVEIFEMCVRTFEMRKRDSIKFKQKGYDVRERVEIRIGYTAAFEVLSS